jgi:hypothetical protein
MLNVKQTLKNLHKKLPTLSLDDLFDVLDCYVEEYTLNVKDWEPKVWYSKSSDPLSTNINCATNGKVKYYDGGGSAQLITEH